MPVSKAVQFLLARPTVPTPHQESQYRDIQMTREMYDSMTNASFLAKRCMRDFIDEVSHGVLAQQAGTPSIAFPLVGFSIICCQVSEPSSSSLVVDKLRLVSLC
jgi:hypothetical protein